MRSVVVCGSKVKSILPDNERFETVEIKGVPVSCGLITTRKPSFDPFDPANRSNVFLRTEAFSCNYRDLSLIFAAIRKGAENSFFSPGSDFVGEVVEIGSGVTGLKPGDRVIADNSYTMSTDRKAADGVLTNRASKMYQIFPESKLMKIPESMPAEVAAAFGIGAQTSYSMVRKLDPVEGANILVTSARSNTSLFVINALRKYSVNLYATTTSNGLEGSFRSVGVKEVIPIPSPFEGYEALKDTAISLGGFDYVIDPFFDLHLEKTIGFIAPNGKYITCGLYEQYRRLAEPQTLNGRTLMKNILLTALVRNLQIIGNCLGTTQDLRNAIQDFASGSFQVVIDEVFTGNRVGAFFQKTYGAEDRFGKVVYKYN